MKRIINFLGVGLMLAFTMLLARPVDAQPRVGVSINFQTFYDELSPYGDWIDYPEYGYTWRPRLGTDFRPYSTNGYWAYTADNDWMWNSGYDWGWAPFHYGRWFYDPMYGWLWVPGYDWSPAWVTWRGGGDYYGWAPIRPGISINIGFGGYNPPYDYWTFAPCRYMTSMHIGRYFYPFRNNVTIFNRTTIINNYGPRGGNYRGGRSYYTNGPRRTDVERFTGRINPLTVRNADRPGRSAVSRNSVSVYRPNVSRGDNRTNYAPGNVQRYDRNSATGRGNSATNRSSNVRSNTGSNGSRNERVNVAPRREDAVRNDRSNSSSSRATRSGQESSSRRVEQAPGNNSSRSGQVRQPANTEVRTRQQQMQRSQAERTSVERSNEVRQRNAAAVQQREVAARRENAARSEAAQRSSAQPQREQSRSVQVQPSRQQSAPRVESRSSGSSRSAGNVSSSRGREGRGR